MDWILDNLRLVIFAVVGIGYWIFQRRKAAAEEQGPSRPVSRPDQRTTAPNADALEQAERLRKIQEEIRRRRAERTLNPSGSAPTPPPLLRQEQAPVRPPAPFEEEGYGYAEEEELSRRAKAEADQRRADEAALYERQRQLAEQLRSLEEKRRNSEGSAAAFATKTREGVEKSRSGRPISEDLRDPASARRAIVLREVLGAPVALRGARSPRVVQE